MQEVEQVEQMVRTKGKQQNKHNHDSFYFSLQALVDVPLSTFLVKQLTEFFVGLLWPVLCMNQFNVSL